MTPWHSLAHASTGGCRSIISSDRGDSRLQLIEVALHDLPYPALVDDVVTVAQDIPDSDDVAPGNIGMLRLVSVGYMFHSLGNDQQVALGCSSKWLAALEIRKRFARLVALDRIN